MNFWLNNCQSGLGVWMIKSQNFKYWRFRNEYMYRKTQLRQIWKNSYISERVGSLGAILFLMMIIDIYHKNVIVNFHWNLYTDSTCKSSSSHLTHKVVRHICCQMLSIQLTNVKRLRKLCFPVDCPESEWSSGIS